MSTTTAQMAQKLYIAYFGRPADPAGYTNAKALLSWNGGSPEVLLADFGKSAEYTAQFANMTAAQKVNLIYQNLFGRAAESAGLNFWAAKVDSGEITLAKAAWTILSGVTAGSGDDTAVNSKVTYAESFTAKLAADNAATVAYNSTTLASVKAEMAKVTTAANLATQTTALDTYLTTMKAAGGSTTGTAGGTFTLTTGNDYADVAGSSRNGGTISDTFKFSSNNDTVTATTATLLAGDNLTDNTSTDNDVLNDALSGSHQLGTSIAGIETYNFATTAATGASNITWGTITGAKTITVTGAATGAIDLTNTSTATGLALVSTVDASGMTSTGAITFSAAGRTGTAASEAITVKTASLGASTITTSGGADTITGGAGVETVDGGAGNDSISTGAGNDSITGGSGNDSIDAGSGNNTISAGAGDDTITLSSGTADRLTFSAVGVVSPNGKDTITGFTAGTAAGADSMNFDAFTGDLNGGGAASTTVTALITLTATGNRDLGAAGDDGSSAGTTVMVLNANTAISAKNYSSAADFGDVFAAAGKVINTTVSALASTDNRETVMIVQGTDQTQIYFIDVGRDGTNTNITTNDVQLVAVLSDVTNTATFAAGQFIV